MASFTSRPRNAYDPQSYFVIRVNTLNFFENRRSSPSCCEVSFDFRNTVFLISFFLYLMRCPVYWITFVPAQWTLCPAHWTLSWAFVQPDFNMPLPFFRDPLRNEESPACWSSLEMIPRSISTSDRQADLHFCSCSISLRSRSDLRGSVFFSPTPPVSWPESLYSKTEHLISRQTGFRISLPKTSIGEYEGVPSQVAEMP